MTRQQLDLLAYIRSYKADHNGLSPCVREMQQGLRLSSRSGVARLLDALADQGAITRRPRRARGVQLAEHAADLAGVPNADLVAECRRRGIEVRAR